MVVTGSDAVKRQLWAADPHQYGPGKVHIVDDEDPRKTYCGRFLEAVPGKPCIRGDATCHICRNGVIARQERKLRHAEWASQSKAREAQRIADNQRWQDWYRSYLLTDSWRKKRDAVIRRAGGLCEGCGENRAVQVHHLTYAHAGNEFLWELRAICRDCHERIHDTSEAMP